MSPTARFSQRARQARVLIERDGVGPVAARLLRRAAERVDHPCVALPVRTDDVLAVDSAGIPAHHTPLPWVPGTPLTVNWVMTPAVGGSGGHTTAMRLIHALEAAGNRCRLFLYDMHAGDLASQEAEIRRCWPEVRADVADAFDGMPDAHATFATSWQTAYLVHRDPSLGRRFYLVQDFEPDFYPAGSEAALAEATYRFGFHGVTAGAWLSGMLGERYGMAADPFPFGCDLDLYALRNQPRDGVAFFARTTTPRRAFELAVLALQSFAADHPDVPIHLYGEPPGRLPFPVVDHGLLTPAELGSLYNRCWAGLALSMTNVSLVPLEMLAAGCIPVMNDAEHNRIVLGDVPVRYAPAEPRALAAALAEVVGARDEHRAQTAASSVQSASWSDAGRIVNEVLGREIAGARALAG